MFVTHKTFLNYMSYLLTLSLNVYVILNYTTKETEAGVNETRVYVLEYSFEWLDILKDVLSITHIVFMIFQLLYHIINWSWLNSIIQYDEISNQSKRSQM